MKKLVSKADNVKLSRFLSDSIEGIKPSYIRLLIKNKDIKINGRRVSSDEIIMTGDTVDVYLDESKITAPEYRLIGDCKDIAVFFKPAGIISEVFAAAIQKAYSPEYRLSHRLDTNTEGLLIFSKSEAAYELIKDAFKKGYIIKKYAALVCGTLNKKLVLTDYLTKDSEKGIVRVFSSPREGAVKIITEAAPIKNYLTPAPFSFAEITLHTGKTHQIRAHLAHYGYPILGDTKYGDFAANKIFKLKRQCLTAYKLGFSFPEGSPLYYLNKISLHIEPSFNADNFKDI